jgi:serine/threonine protein kinase
LSRTTSLRGTVKTRAPTVLGEGGRFVVERELGAGEFGVVYSARDRRTGQTIAVKLLRQLDRSAVTRFEREFRLLSGMTHPNLVRLGELLRDEEQWFFTMELVRGTDFVTWIRADVARANPASRPRSSLTMAFGQRLAETNAYQPCSVRGLRRLRAALLQLADALEAIHAAGFVHRDLRPANVRVTPEGRVVVLDYGLTMQAGTVTLGGGPQWVGTAAYMAPEQWNQAGASPASDWYAVGVMMFEALTGALPFFGSAHEVFVRKRTVSAPRPSSLIDAVPAVLDDLCTDLLSVAPEQRPPGVDVNRRLQSAQTF